MAGGGGAWKVAYADFVTAMMAFFLVMWLVGQGSKVKEAVAEHFREPPDSLLMMRKTQRNDERTRGRYRVRSNNPFPSTDPKDPEFHRPRIQTIREAERTAVGTVVYFAEESAELDDQARKRLDALVPEVQGKPQKIEIRGHASRKPLPPDSPLRDSWQASYARCQATLHYLVSKGLPVDRMRLSQAASSEPITTQPDPAKLSLNPRVEVFLVNEWADELIGTREERTSRYQDKP